jgi:hypothetical protein
MAIPGWTDPYANDQKPSQTQAQPSETQPTQPTTNIPGWNDPYKSAQPTTSATDQTEYLQPRSMSQVGRDVYNYGRVAADQAIVPGTVDNALSALPAWAPGSGDIETQRARTKQSESELSPEMAWLARFQGQRLSIGRAIAGATGTPNPDLDAAITGGGGTFMHGNTNPIDIGLNAATDVGLSGLSDVAGTYAAKYVKPLIDRGAKAVSENIKGIGSATARAGAAALEDIRNAYTTGGNVAATAEQYARQYGGQTGDAIRRVAEYARQPLDATTMQRATTGLTGYLGSKAAGASDVANTAVGLGSSYILDPAMRAYNATRRNLDVHSAIDQLYPTLTGVTKTAIDPEAWRSALHSASQTMATPYENVKNYVMGVTPPW